MAKAGIAAQWLRDNDVRRDPKWVKAQKREDRKGFKGKMLFLHPLEEKAWKRQIQREVEYIERGSFDLKEFLQDHRHEECDECIYVPFVRPYQAVSVTVNGVSLGAARYMCIEVHGVPPSRHHVARHMCGSGHLACVNPRHLKWGTAAENSRDMHLHTARPLYIEEMPEDKWRAIAEDGRLPNVIAVEYGIPTKAVLAIQAR